jgi:hypothetical protein
MRLLLTLVIALVPLPFLSANSYETNDPNNPLNVIIQYCIQHADRAAAGENVTKDLILAGILSHDYTNMTCADAQKQHDINLGLEKIFDAYRRLHPN